MSFDPTNENESLDPGAAGPESASPNPAPPPPPPPADPLFDEPGVAAPGPATPTAARTTGSGVDRKTLIGAGVGAAVIALGAVVGINLATSGAESAEDAAAAGPAALGPGGQAPGVATDDQGGVPGQQGATGQAPGGPMGGQGGPAGTSGTVEDVSDNSLTVATDAGESVEVATSDDTEVSIAETGSADDVDEGDTVLVIGQSSDDGTVTAERVVDRSGDDDGPAGPDGMGPVMGEVASVDADTFVVRTDSGDLTVTMTADTTVVVERQASLGDLSEGDDVFVHTEQDEDGNAVAERILTGDALPGGGPGAAMPGGAAPGGTAPGGAAPDASGTTGSTGSNLAPADPGSGSGVPGANAGPGGVTTT